MTNFVGSHRILRANRPSDVAGFLFIFTLGVMFLGRYFFEGVPYQVSFSAMIGDTAGLIVIVLRGQEILMRPQIQIPDWLQRSGWHVAIILCSILLCIVASILTFQNRNGQLMDMFHDVVIAPLFVYVMITLIPILIQNGTRRELIEIGFYFGIWLVFVVIDWATGMIEQRIWLTQHLHVIWPLLSTTIVWH